jgi:hypothetical protein
VRKYVHILRKVLRYWVSSEYEENNESGDKTERDMATFGLLTLFIKVPQPHLRLF